MPIYQYVVEPIGSGGVAVEGPTFDTLDEARAHVYAVQAETPDVGLCIVEHVFTFDDSDLVEEHYGSPCEVA